MHLRIYELLRLLKRISSCMSVHSNSTFVLINKITRLRLLSAYVRPKACLDNTVSHACMLLTNR